MNIVLDIETNLEFDRIWCVVTRDIDTGEVYTWKDSYGFGFDFQDHINAADKIIMHNGIFFDAPMLKKIWGITMKKSQVVDTLVMSRLYNPSLEDGHSLDAWGKRLGFLKTEFNDFSQFTQEMLDYCIQDTLVTQKLYEHLTKEMKNDFSQKSIDLEHQAAIIIAEQERNGFKLDEKGATQLLCELKTKLEAIKVEMESIFPPRVESGRTNKKTGKPLKDIVTPFNPGSRQQIAERLQEKGWKPKKHTEKGSVIVDETTLEEIVKECS